MLVEIVLPNGTDQIAIADIPKLIADAIAPPVSGDEPTPIIELRKFPLTKEYIAEWCGDKAFSVHLTDNDWEYLRPTNSGSPPGVWSHLPPVVLPMDDAAWEPYRLAIEAKPPAGWALKVEREAPWAIQMFRHHGAMECIKVELEKASANEKITPVSQLTLTPHRKAYGDLLWSCIITLDDFIAFAKDLNYGVTVANGESLHEVPSGVPVFKPRQTMQEHRILELLTSNGYTPTCLPKRDKGKSGAKAAIKLIALAQQPALFTSKSFDKAWDRLRASGAISGG